MKRNLFILTLALVLVLALALTGCEKPCEHEWKNADCANPKTCELCDATEGAPLGHTWKAATCNAAKTCETCGEVSGQPLGHSWSAATCEAPKTCSACKAEEGEALEHTWVDATTEAPKTCTVCNKTEGDPIDTDDRFVTSKCQEVFGTWSGTYRYSYGYMGVDPSIAVTFDVTLIFTNDGQMTMDMAPNTDTFKNEMFTFTRALTLKTFADQGINEEQADAAMQATYGMTLDEYITASVKDLNPADMAVKLDMVYYVDGGKIYNALNWDATMAAGIYSIDGNTMHYAEKSTEMQLDLTLTKVSN